MHRFLSRAAEQLTVTLALALAAPLVGCDDGDGSPPPSPPTDETPPDPAPPPDPAEVEFEAPPPPLPRLTNAQYRNSVRALFGDAVVVPPAPTIDLRSGGLLTVGAGDATLSPRGVENLEQAAYAVAGQVLAPERRDAILGCAPDAAGCLDGFVRAWGRRIWRRPLEDGEVTRLVAVGERAVEVLGEPAAAYEFALAAMLQSPHFIFRRERPADPAGGPYDDYAMASRLSFLLWNTTPDDALLDAAEAGELTDDAALRARVEAMLVDPRARDGLMEFFVEWLGLDALDELRKDPTVFTAMSPEVAPAARRETLTVLDEIVFGHEDFRGFIDGRRTWLDRKLASIYGVRAPAREGFAAVELPTQSGRRGFLGQVSFLAANAHPTSSSATLRGKFVRERILCHVIPPPPSDVDTSIPEPSGTTLTLRDRVAEHLTDPTCAGCHRLMDGVGLAFENFDGLGTWRDTDNGATIDASGELDGETFTDAAELADLIAAHDDFPRCVTTYVSRYGTGQIEGRAQREMIDALAARFVAGEYRFVDLVADFVMSPAFRVAGPQAEEEQ